MQDKKYEEEGWLRLDNAAKIFPAIYNAYRTSVFRLTAELDRPVNLTLLQKALKKTQELLPYFTVQMRRGFFWYWLDFDSPGIPIMYDNRTPCRHFSYNRRQQPQARVLVRKDQISAEFFHALTDGSGGLIFLMTLVSNYAEMAGVKVPPEFSGYLSPKYDKNGMEDAYNQYFEPHLPAPRSLPRAYHLPFPKNPDHGLNILPFEVPADQIKKLAVETGLTVTEYLAAIYLWSLQEVFYSNEQKILRRKEPIIRIQIPVNLRKVFPSSTLRNFAVFVVPEIDTRLGRYTFEEICRTVHLHMQMETDPKMLKRIIYRNVRNEKNVFIRLTPLFLKNRVLKHFYLKRGTSIYSGLITNLGRISMTGEFDTFVRRMRFYPPPPDMTRVGAGVVTVNNRMVITFSNVTECNRIEQEFIGFLKKRGIYIKLIDL